MPTFSYKAILPDGRISEGRTEGRNRMEIVRILGQKGMQVVSVEERAGTSSKQSKKTPAKEVVPRREGGIRISSKQLIYFTEELSDLLSAGVQLADALQSIAGRSGENTIKTVAAECHKLVRDGVTLASALRQVSPSFSDLYCNLVEAGEISGALGDNLKRHVQFLTVLAELRGKLVTALIYPGFLIVSGAGVLAMFAFFLIPKLRRLVESTGGELPLFAAILLQAGDFIKANWLFVLGGLFVAVIVLFFAFQQESMKSWWDRTQLKLPLLGNLLLTRFNVQFVETLCNLLLNGLPLVKALELVRGTTRNRYINERIGEINERVTDGASLSLSMEKSGVFEPGLVDMARMGEATGKLANALGRAGDRLDREFNRSIDRIATVIQPAIILVMAVVVGSMAYMMISVIYETISVLRNR